MKLLNLFKNETTNTKKVTFQTLEKNQLEKVIGGGDSGSDITNTTVSNDPTTDRTLKQKSHSNLST